MLMQDPHHYSFLMFDSDTRYSGPLLISYAASAIFTSFFDCVYEAPVLFVERRFALHSVSFRWLGKDSLFETSDMISFKSLAVSLFLQMNEVYISIL